MVTTVRVAPGPGALQKAIDSLPMDGLPAILELEAGVYEEKIELRRPYTMLKGAGADKTVIRWHDAAFTILEDGMKRGTFRSYTMLVDAAQVTIANLTIENTAGKPRETSGQCVALYADGDGFLCSNVTLRSHQDTLFTAPLPPKEVEKNGFLGPKQFAPRTPQRHIYTNCRIYGDVDFIYGGAAAWFEGCEIIFDDGRDAQNGGEAGYCTAASTPEGQKYGYVFSHCRFLSTGDEEGCVLLGRPWREFAKTVLLSCYLGKHIAPCGWGDWGKPAFHEHGYYAEYGSTGPGAAGQRVPYVHLLTEEEAAAITPEDFALSLV